MAISNFDRLIQMADNVFAAKSDPGQLDVDWKVLERLRELHPATVAELDEGMGPVAWVLLIPTTEALMRKFLSNEISEKRLYEMTEPGMDYDAIYLCSAMVLEEYRQQGIAKRLTLESIDSIRMDHPIKALFVWSFTNEGDIAAESIARQTSLPLYKRGLFSPSVS
jgi:ribosomal protein S18 acetylase RimI-like enzyme